MPVIAFVPARGGSRGIPGKNSRPFCGRPLIAWCLDALEAARGVDRIVLATDSDEIEGVARGLGLAKLEIYAFANCADVMRLVEGLPSGGGPAPWIESFGNEN